MLVLIGGGVRTGKSGLALRMARTLGERRLFVATAEARDGEMAERIQRHVRERGTEFHTVEAPLQVVEAIDRAEADVVVVDCLTLWMSNLLLLGDTEQRILSQVERLIATLKAKKFHSILITNEVGMGIVPETPVGRAFRDISGRAHQAIAARADEVYFGALGMMLRLKPGPVMPC